MALELRLQQKLTQQLVMTPQLRQAIKLLQLNHLELADALRAELSENPVLEEPTDGASDDSFDTSLKETVNAETVLLESQTQSSTAPDEGAGTAADNLGPQEAQIVSDMSATLQEPPGASPEPSNKEVEKDVDWESYLDSYSYSLPASTAGASSEQFPSFEASLTKSESLHDHLRWQIRMQGLSEQESRIAFMLIEEINADGYLTTDGVDTVCQAFELERSEVENVVGDLQKLEPLGVGARSIQECLLIQCSELHPEADIALAIIEHHLDKIERHDYPSIARELKVTLDDIGQAVKLLTTLEPKPGRAYADREPQYITPDIYLSKMGSEWVIVLNEDGLPKLRISNYYKRALGNSAGNTKDYLQDKMRCAVWLIRSIHMRQRTIYRVMESILKYQTQFFDKGVSHLKPLVLKDIADDIEMHESTISRVTTNKYVHTPQGIFELKYFFNSAIGRSSGEGIASESVRDYIKRLIEDEDPKKPLSDQKLVTLLKSKDITIARRTVAKYREMLRIPPSSKRKKRF
jgi:RNA polymerase sigma-54 factor